jgi:hypothetical protein
MGRTLEKDALRVISSEERDLLGHTKVPRYARDDSFAVTHEKAARKGGFGNSQGGRAI